MYCLAVENAGMLQIVASGEDLAEWPGHGRTPYLILAELFVGGWR